MEKIRKIYGMIMITVMVISSFVPYVSRGEDMPDRRGIHEACSTDDWKAGNRDENWSTYTGLQSPFLHVAGRTYTSGRCANGEKELSILENPFRYSSYYTDPESGMNYCNARYYSPELSTWITRDTWNVPNRYDYCSGNPVSMMDPGGHDPDDAMKYACFGMMGLSLALMAVVPAALYYRSRGPTTTLPATAPAGQSSLPVWGENEILFAQACDEYDTVEQQVIKQFSEIDKAIEEVAYYGAPLHFLEQFGLIGHHWEFLSGLYPELVRGVTPLRLSEILIGLELFNGGEYTGPKDQETGGQCATAYKRSVTDQIDRLPMELAEDKEIGKSRINDLLLSLRTDLHGGVGRKLSIAHVKLTNCYYSLNKLSTKAAEPAYSSRQYCLIGQPHISFKPETR